MHVLRAISCSSSTVGSCTTGDLTFARRILLYAKLSPEMSKEPLLFQKRYRKPRQNTPASPPIFQKSRFNAAFFVVKRRFFPTCFSLQTEKMYLQWEAERAKEEFDVHPIR